MAPTYKQLYDALNTLRLARKINTEEFRRASYGMDVQSVLDAIEYMESHVLYDSCAIKPDPNGFGNWQCGNWKTGEACTLDAMIENARNANCRLYICGDNDSPAPDIRGYIQDEPPVVVAFYDDENALTYWGLRPVEVTPA